MTLYLTARFYKLFSFVDGLMRNKGNRYFNYFALCVPWIVMNIVGISLDVVTFFVYQSDYSKLLWDLYHVMTMMEVSNRDEVRKVLSKNYSVLTYPIFNVPQILSFIAAKLFLPLFFLLIFGLLSIKSMWAVIAENKRIRVFLQRAWNKKKLLISYLKCIFIGS